MITKKQLDGLSFTEFDKMSTFPRHNSYQKIVEAKENKICESCGKRIHPKEMYVLLKRKFGGKFERHHIKCPKMKFIKCERCGCWKKKDYGDFCPNCDYAID